MTYPVTGNLTGYVMVFYLECVKLDTYKKEKQKRRLYSDYYKSYRKKDFYSFCSNIVLDSILTY